MLSLTPPVRPQRRGTPCRAAFRYAVASLLLLAVAAVLTLGCAGAGADPSPGGDEMARGGAMQVRRGDFRSVALLTGELKAERAVDLLVPRSPTWQVQLRWLVEDGSDVAAGEPVVEFDSSQFTSDLEEKLLARSEKRTDLERLAAEQQVTEAEKRFAIEKAEAELERARGRADVPPELLSGRDYQDRQLALERAELDLAKARQDLEATLASQRAEVSIKQLELERAEREIAIAQQAVESMRLDAPEAGIFVVQDHPWEGRKLQEGDMVHVGQTVARLPDLTSMQVEAVLSDVDDGRVRAGMSGTCTLDTYPDRAYPCQVRSVAPVAQESARSSLLRYFRVDVELLERDPKRMRPGMSVKVELTTDERPDVLLAPRQALDETADPPTVRLADGGVETVDLGPCNERECVVEATAGDALAAGTRLAPTDDTVPAVVTTLAGGGSAAEEG